MGLDFRFWTWLNDSDVTETDSLSDSVTSMFFEKVQVAPLLKNTSCSRSTYPFASTSSLGWQSGENLLVYHMKLFKNRYHTKWSV